MAKSVFNVLSQSTSEMRARSGLPETQFSEVVVQDVSSRYADPAYAAIAVTLILHQFDGARNPLYPAIVRCDLLQVFGLPDSTGLISDVDGTIGGLADDIPLLYQVTTRLSDNRDTTYTGYVVSQGILRTPGAPAWDAVTNWAGAGPAGVLYPLSGVNHNFYGASGIVSNVNHQPDSSPTFWTQNDISSGENAALLGVHQMLDPTYNAGTTYALGDYVTYLTGSWKSLQNANTGHTPAVGAWWAVVNPPRPVSVVLQSNAIIY